MDENRHAGDLILDDCRTMLPSLMLSLKSDIMDCRVAWCRFAMAQSERLERPKHCHVVYEIHYLLEGRMNYSFPIFGNYTAEKGHFMLIPRDTFHSTASGDDNTEYFVIAFSVKSDNKAINTVFSQGSYPFCGEFTPAMEGMISSLKLKVHENNFTDSLSTKLMVHSILLEAVDAIIESMGLKQLYKNAAIYSDPRVSNIERIVNANKYSQKLRGEDVAQELHLTTRQLNRICNQYFGCSINQYITNGRIESMKELLRQPCYTLRDVSSIFGFMDVYAFIKHFTKYAGISPGRYRKIVGSDLSEEQINKDETNTVPTT